MYGLSARTLREIFSLIAENGAIKKVLLFGSRARGDNKPYSDIDLAIEFEGEDLEDSIKDAFACSKIPYKMDVINLNTLKNDKLLKHILDEGVVLFDKSQIGKEFMAKVLLLEKYEDFKSALIRLDEALTKDIEQESLFIDGTIQRFEFSFELCWKLMKAYLHYQGIDVTSPRGAIRESSVHGVISNTNAWIKMLEKRNLTSHTYNEETALEVYTAIKHVFIKLLHAFDAKISELIKQNT